ncbi:MAG: hypothetical protein H6745_03315 [Deltaproteobacteria bacterium]|nr:hypothetical protein [Deltaproteobacteria bacterium]
MRIRLRLLPAVALSLAVAACSTDDGATTPKDTATAADADAAGPDGDTGDDAADTAEPADTFDPSPGLGVDYTATPPGATPRFDLAATDWMSVGWPSDRYRGADGHVDLENIRSDASPPLLDDYLALGEEALDGWGLNGGLYIGFDGPLDAATLPAPEASRDALSPLQLVNVSAGTARYGERLPLQFRFYTQGDDPYYQPNTLATHQVEGFPLAEGATYCLVVTRAVKDAAGNYLQAAPGFLDALADTPWLADFRAWLRESPLRPEDVATASCFTTHHPTAELRAVSDWIDANEPPELSEIFEPSAWNEFQGLYLAPNFQAGAKPYTSDGDIRFDAGGDPIVQEQETLRFLMLVPRDHAMPAVGWPVILYAHGTTGDYQSCRGDVADMVADGFVAICIDQPLHGIRGPGLNDNELEVFSFNFVNPKAGRSNFRQAAIDTLTLSRMVVAGRFDLDATETTVGEPVELDPDRVFFFGHSHGGLSGALAFAVDTRVKGGVLSGAAGVLIETILRRKDPADFAALVGGLLGVTPEDLDSFHPMLSLVQMLVDATDPINYAPYWVKNPPPGGAKDMFVSEGTEDAASPSVGTDAMTAAAGLPQIEPIAKVSPAHVLHGIAPLRTPVARDVDTPDGPRTAAMRQYQGGSHFVALSDPAAKSLVRGFFRSLRDGAPVISDGPATIPGVSLVPGAACASAAAIPGDAVPVDVLGNTSLSPAALATTGGACGVAGGPGRELVYGFTPQVAGTYRFQLILPPAIDRNTPRYGPNLVYVTRACDMGQCLALGSGGLVDVALDANTAYDVVVDGATWLDKGPFTLRVTALCEQRDCDGRECGSWGCGSCGTCDAGSVCNADGRCEERPAGDTCDDVIPITSVPAAIAGTTVGFLSDFTLEDSDCTDAPYRLGASSSDVFYRFAPPAAGVYSVKLGPDFDGLLVAASDCSDVHDTCRAASRVVGADEALHVTLGPGESVDLIVDGAFNNSNQRGAYTLTIDTCVPDCDGRSCGDDGCGGQCGGGCDAESCVEDVSCLPFPDVCARTSACESIRGDTCEQAFEVGALPYQDSRNTADFESDYGFGAGWCPGNGGTWGFAAADVAYRFAPEHDGLYHFQLDTGNPVFDASLYLVRDCADIRGTCVAADERDKNESIWQRLDGGDAVYVIVDGWNNSAPQTGKYGLSISECVPSCDGRVCGGDGCNGSCGGCGALESCSGGQCVPAFGIDCAHARGVGDLPWKQTASTASFSNRSTNACGDEASGDLANDVSYGFRAPHDGSFTFHVSAGFPAQLYVTSACEAAPTSCLASGGATAVVDLREDDVVYVIVDGAGHGSDAGSFTLEVSETCVPACDGKACGGDGCGGTCGACAAPADVCIDDACVDPTSLAGNTCANPYVVGALPFMGAGDTRRALNHYAVADDACPGFVRKGEGSADEAWRFEAPAAGRYRVTLAPSGWDAILYAVTDCDDIGQTCLAGDDGQLGEVVELDLAAGAIVMLVVDGEDNWRDDAGAYTITVEAAP